MFDINGQPLNEGDTVQLLCKVVSADPREGVRVRVMNSEMELVVGCKHDEALGGYIADSELAKFVEMPVAQRGFSKEEICPVFSVSMPAPTPPAPEVKTNAIAGDSLRRGVS